jgi:hypothetical protein
LKEKEILVTFTWFYGRQITSFDIEMIQRRLTQDLESVWRAIDRVAKNHIVAKRSNGSAAN